MKVCEIFTSVQGESSYAGMPCTFIRMTGCNLRCSYCDTTYAYHEGRELSEEDILEEVKRANVNLVEITGGEPLLQREIYPLIERLIRGSCKVLVETNGSLSIKDVDKKALIVLDIKTPGSGMSDKMDLSNIKILKPADEVKFVVTDRTDYDWAKEIIYKYNVLHKCPVLLSPAHGILPPENLVRWMIEDKLQARLNLQIHKYIFGSEKRKV